MCHIRFFNISGYISALSYPGWEWKAYPPDTFFSRCRKINYFAPLWNLEAYSPGFLAGMAVFIHIPVRLNSSKNSSRSHWCTIQIYTPWFGISQVETPICVLICVYCACVLWTKGWKPSSCCFAVIMILVSVLKWASLQKASAVVNR